MATERSAYTARLNLNGIDLSGYVTNMDLSHDADEKTEWHEKIAGLQDSSLTVSGTWHADTRTLVDVIRETSPERDVTVQVPDSWWQGVKSWLQTFWPLRWLKVRWRVYATRGVPRLDPETGNITISTTGPLTVTTITRRGKP